MRLMEGADMGEHCLRVYVGADLALLDVHGPVFERYRFDLAQMVAAEIAQLFTASQFGFLWQKAIAVDRRFCRPAYIASKG